MTSTYQEPLVPSGDEEFVTDEEDGWDDSDLELIEDEDQLITSRRPIDNPEIIQDQNNHWEECWECSKCLTINNVKLCIRKYNSSCCGCEDELYIPFQTETIMKSKWDTPVDYLLRENKVWKCTVCYEINSDIKSLECANCKSQRYKQHENNNETKMIEWQCIKCYRFERKIEDKCSICNCIRPFIRDYSVIESVVDMVNGFCRIYLNKNIPKVIKDIIIKYFKKNTFSIWTNQSPKQWRGREKTTCYNKGWKMELFGDEFIEYPMINSWKLRINVDEKYVVKVDGDNQAAKIFDVAIGVKGKATVHNEILNTPSTVNKYFLIYGDGRESAKNGSYPIFRDGDTIEIELDCAKQALYVGINEYWFGAVYDDLLENGKYQLYVCIKQQGVSVTSVH